MIKIFSDPEAMADFMAGQWFASGRQAVEQRGFFAAAVSGGQTPQLTYQRLASRQHDPLWRQTFLFMVDERFVSWDHADRTARWLEENLVSQVDIPKENVFYVPGQGSAEQTARQYENDLEAFFKTKGQAGPVFDLMLLGIGEDGHTASLFPGAFPLETDRLVLDVAAAQVKHLRVTLSLPVINLAREVIFLVSGAKKAAVVKRIIEGREPALPASRVDPPRGQLLFALDKDAAAGLSGPGPDDNFSCQGF